ncbi:hypothetical protein [Dawidia soli]|uniref:Uncharacterized protein n=1 Tax=Dawidia soli TaxID=2782352 RepID=A0AAP2GF60_9BACT|nr:hypothetical protein [Dawidia soli]MBT1689152.1 hypothetical protein [Dawidia soli]
MKQILITSLILWSFNSEAQDTPQKFVDRFFVLYQTKGANEAIDYIFSTNNWMNESKDQVENVKFKLNSTLKLLGKYEGYDLITKKSIGEHLSLYTFLIRYDRQPLRFTMTFYNPSKDWRLYNFSYDDSLDEELKEAGKAYRLKENLDY